MKKSLTLVFVSSLVVLPSCGLIPGLGPAPLPGQLRIINAVADMPAGVNVFFGEVRQNSSPLLFRTSFPLTGSYQSTPAGSLKYSLCEVDKPSCTKQDQSVTVTSEKNTSLVLVGTKDTGDDGGATARPLEIVQLEDDTPAPAASNAKIRLLHAASLPAANKVDVYVTLPNDVLSGQPAELEYKKTNIYRNYVAGALRIRVTLPGDTASVLVDSGSANFADGKTYTVLITNPDAGVVGSGVTILTDK